MKVLLYETGQSGHRPLYRNYYKHALEQSGVTVEIQSKSDYGRYLGFNEHLQKLAKKAECDLIHLLTLDDHTRRLFLSSQAPRASSRTPVIGTYYLYRNTMHPFKGWALRRLFIERKICALIVPSTMQLLNPENVNTLPFQVFPLPEPEPPDESPVFSKPDSLKYFGIPHEWDVFKVLLVYGILNKRRGVDQIVHFLQKERKLISNMRFIFAGPIDRGSIKQEVVNSLDQLTEAGYVKVIDRWISDVEVALLYDIADVFCIIPQETFQGANSTVAQALKAGLCIVAPADSVAGQCAELYDRAALFRRGDSSDFVRCLHEAPPKKRNSKPHSLEKKSIPLSVGIQDFGHLLCSIYKDVC
jgi:glycosyltransferase involved in cell wall biosynthesis